ncbi:hypothetical protein J7K74_03125 [Candidatus Woesearchaeota archaeon]|nr:hypothetical protein [Candidatus Woesearchaeota archaeon]
MLDYYHPKILEFLYELSKLDRYYSDRELSRRIRIQGEIVTSKTIRRWFDFLHSTCFDYHPYIEIERLGLELFYAFYPLKKGVIDSPYSTYLNVSISLKSLKRVITQAYWIPVGNKDLMSGILPMVQSFYSKEVIVGPLHRMIDRNGNIRVLDKLSMEQLESVKRVLSNLNRIEEPKMIKAVKRNPLIIPVAFEYDKEHWSSIEVWRQIYDKLGENAWKYFRKIKKKSKHVAIKHIQLTLRDFSELGLIKFMNINYAPLEARNHYFWVYFSTDRDSLRFLLEELSLLAPFIYLYQGHEKGKYLLNLMIPNYLLDRVLGLFLDNSSIIDAWLVDYDSSRPLWNREWLKFSYHQAFNPEMVEWKSVSEKTIVKRRVKLVLKKEKEDCCLV